MSFVKVNFNVETSGEVWQEKRSAKAKNGSKKLAPEAKFCVLCFVFCVHKKLCWIGMTNVLKIFINSNHYNKIIFQETKHYR